MRKYLPIRIFSIRFGYGWWLGKYFFFLGKHATEFAIIPMSSHYPQCTYENGNGIDGGDIMSWSKERQQEKEEDKKSNVLWKNRN